MYACIECICRQTLGSHGDEYVTTYPLPSKIKNTAMDIIADNCVCNPRPIVDAFVIEFNYAIEIARGGLSTQLSAMISIAVFLIFDGNGYVVTYSSPWDPRVCRHIHSMHAYIY